MTDDAAALGAMLGDSMSRMRETTTWNTTVDGSS